MLATSPRPLDCLNHHQSVGGKSNINTNTNNTDGTDATDGTDTKSSSQPSSLLSSDIVLGVLSYLMPKEVSRCSLVCRGWNEAISSQKGDRRVWLQHLQAIMREKMVFVSPSLLQLGMANHARERFFHMQALGLQARAKGLALLQELARLGDEGAGIALKAAYGGAGAKIYRTIQHFIQSKPISDQILILSIEPSLANSAEFMHALTALMTLHTKDSRFLLYLDPNEKSTQTEALLKKQWRQRRTWTAANQMGSKMKISRRKKGLSLVEPTVVVTNYREAYLSTPWLPQRISKNPRSSAIFLLPKGERAAIPKYLETEAGIVIAQI